MTHAPSMAKTAPAVSPPRRHRRGRLYAWTWRAPILIWQAVFFIGPLLFMVALSFWQVENYRPTPAFSLDNWASTVGIPAAENAERRAQRRWERAAERGTEPPEQTPEEAYAERLWSAPFWTSLTRGLLFATGVTLLVSVLALPAAYVMAFSFTASQRRWLLFLLVIPFFTSYVVRTYTWIALMETDGLINRVSEAIGFGQAILYRHWSGQVVGYVTLVLPLVLVIQTFALTQVDRRLVEAAWNLRCSRLRTVWQVIIPEAKIGLSVAALFSFILVFGDYFSPTYLGAGTYRTLTGLIVDNTKGGNNWPAAAAVGVVMIVTLFAVAFTVLGVLYRKRGRGA